MPAIAQDRRSELVPILVPSRRSASEQPIKRIARLLAFRDRGDGQAGGQPGGHILHAVHGQVDRAAQKRLVDFLGEQALAAHLRQRHVLNLVAAGLDDLDARFYAEGLELLPRCARPATGPASTRASRINDHSSSPRTRLRAA